MTEILRQLDALRRPAILMGAARIGAEDCRREPHLRRVFGQRHLPHLIEGLRQLISIEQDLNTKRTRGDFGYHPGDHVEVLIALMGEAKLLRRCENHAPRLTVVSQA